METQEGCLAAPRLSYLDVGMDYLEREEPQETDDIRKNLDDRFLECLSEPSNLSQKNSLDSKDHMCVYLRIRPFTAAEIEQNESQDCVSIQDSTSVLVKPPQNFLNGRLSEKGSGPVAQKFTFTQVFGPETTQFQFFDGTIKQNMIDFMEGQNRLIFTYGVTNAGKTFTFQGTKTDAGILPRSMNLLFDSIKGNVYLKMDLKPHRCRDYVRLTKEQVKVETALKNSILRQYKEVDPHCSMKSNNSKASVDISDTINEEVISGFEHSSSIISESEERERESEQYKLNVDSSVKFSVWVSFCEIYNECIFDLLDPISGDKFYKRKTLRLAQDVKGFSFVKDIQWIQVSDAKEACKILALGKKFQSIANTKLNSSSSRSHSIFNIRLLRIDDISRVVKVSELALCDLAGSERCTKTQNEGERLKESGNINTSLLILGKCINALKNSQQSKIPRHVPFRESKLTHYLQSFFSGKGKVCMIVNICQSASSCDETLNVLKFSAVAQKVLILDSCTSSESISCGPKKSARDVSFIINNADNKMWASRKRATVHWDSALEDVMEHGEEDESLDCTHEDEDDDDVEKSEQIIVEKDEYLKMLQLVEDLKTKLMSERREKLLMELKIREEVAKEFSEHFMQRENDLCEYMQREKELVEDRCDERLEIFQDLVKKCSAKKNEEDEDTKIPPSETEFTSRTSCNEDNARIPPETLLTSVKSDLAVIKKQAVQAYFHIASIPDPPEAISELEKRLSLAEAELSNTQDELKKSTMELKSQIDKCSKTISRLDEAEKKLLTQKDEIIDLTKIIQEKDSAIEKLKAHVAHWEAKFEEYDKTMNNIKGEMKKMSKNDTESIGRKRPLDEHSGPSDQPPSKKELVENITTNFPAAQKQINVPDLCESSMQEIENEKCETEKYKEQMKNFKQNIALLEEKLSRSVDQVMQMESKNETLVSELQMSKHLNLSLEETVKALTNEVDRNKQNIDGKVAQIRTIQVKLDEFVNSGIKDTADLANFNFIDLIEESKNVNQSSAVTESQTRMENSGRESTFYSAIDGLWKEFQRVLQESTKKNQLIKELKQQLDNLNNEISLLKNENIELQHNFITVTAKDELLAQLRNQLSEGTNALECKEKCILESKKEIIVLRNQIDGSKEKITELESLLDSQNDTQVKMGSLEMQNKEKATAVMTLENRLEEVEMKRTDCENKLNTLNDYKVNLEQEIVNLQNKCTTFENTCQEKEKQVEDATQEIKQLKKDLSQQAKEFQNLRLDLQRKEEDYTDLKDKLNDAKKQIHQVEKEVSSMREEKKLLTNKLCEYEKLKNQMSGELEMKQRTIQQLKKDPFDNEKNRETMRLYQIACEDVKTKEKIIEDMRTALLEQEQTQTEQDQALEAKIEEADKLTEELEEWKNKYRELETNSCKILSVIPECEKNILQTNSAEVSKLQSQLREYEEKHISERKKWLDEKMKLLAQTKESETHRNKEMRKFAEDRERFIKQQTEIEQLNAQLAEKDNTLLKWREERDQLLSELEIQLKSLLSSNMEKEKEIENLKNRRISQTHEENSVVIDLQKQLTSSDETIKELQQKLAQLEQCQNSSSGLIATDEVKEQTVDKTVDKPGETNLLHTQETKHSTSSLSSIDECQDGSQTVLDSSSISTESGKPSRFPKPELEIHFSPVKPNKFAVKHHGDDSPITVKISRPARKRKSHEMEQDIIRTENKKNALAKTFNKTPCSLSSLTLNSSELKKSQRQNLKKQTSSSSTMSGQKKDGTFQKLGDFFQSSPSIFHTKAKKLLQTISSPKPTEVTVCGKENESKPKRNRRRLYTTDISVPLDIPIHPMVLDKNEKESDHLIMKRRLRTRTAK